MAPEPIFLTFEQVLQMHEEQIALFGGDPAPLTEDRGRGLLESALAQPEASWGGELLHSFPFGMASAYLFHIARNHPFEDGNKRVALDACLTFLMLNGQECTAAPDELTRFVLGVASGDHGKAAIAEWLAAHCHPIA